MTKLEQFWDTCSATAKSKVSRWSYDKKVKFLKDNEWGNKGHWDNWFDPRNGWNYSLHDGCVIHLTIQLYDEKK